MTLVTKNRIVLYGLIQNSNRERVVTLKKLQGIWKNKKPDPMKELGELRREWK